MRYRTLALAALFITTPLIGNAQAPTMEVLLSEIAWMGTDDPGLTASANASNEWIEIYNFSTSPRDLTGWTIEGEVSVTLSGTLPPHGVAVLERTDDNTLPGVTALLTYTGELPNGGGTLTIKNGSGAVSDQATWGADGSGLGGTNTSPKKTPQRTRTGSWVTAAPTPGDQNAQVNDPVATTTTESTNTQTTSSSNTTSRSGGGGSSRKSTAEQKQKEVPPALALSVKGPKTAYVNQNVTFEAVPTGVGKTIVSSLSYDWNLGDTYTGKGKSVSHVFSYPGEYIVVVEGSFAKQNAMARHEVKVLPVSFTLSKLPNGDVEVKNNASYEVDLGSFSLRGGVSGFTFPKYTFVKANGTLVVPSTRIGRATALSLHDGQGVAVVSTGAGSNRPQQSFATRPQPQVVTETPKDDAPMASAESTVIRIGETETAPRVSVLNRFFARIARIFGS